jgi:hypothetical protein
MLHIVAFRWGEKYGPEYVNKLQAAIDRNLTEDYRFCVLHPLDEDRHLTEIKGCFARLRLFDPEYQRLCGFKEGDRIVCMDLDMVITGSLDGLFDRSEPFVILQGVNASNPCPYNGSLWMLTAGYRPDVWHEFSVELAGKIVAHDFPDDQGWMWDMIPDAGAFGPEDGVYAFQKKSWPKGEELPKGARIVAFPGWRDPSQYVRLPWVAEHWRA